MRWRSLSIGVAPKGARRIAQWFVEEAPAEPVLLIHLQQSLGLLMAEVWMELLLEGKEVALEQRG